jgi:HK97 family phage portal protein
MFDGKNTKDIDSTQWRVLSNKDAPNTYARYRTVPYLYRAIDIRAKTVSNFPFSLERNGKDVTDNEIYTPVINNIIQLLFRTEGALCLYGRAYWTKDIENRIPVPYWLLPTAVTPYYIPGKGLQRYDYYAPIDSAYSSKYIKFDPDELIVFNLPSLGSEGYYGVSPAQVALSSANTLYNIDEFASYFFERGAIKATILQVDGNPTQKQKDELKNWWASLLSGIRNAFETAVLSGAVNPVIVGSGLEELKDNDITERREKHICAALGIPHSLVSADAANYATSMSDRLNFMTHTILPEVEFIYECINEQLLQPYGLKFIPNPQQLEVFQQSELEKAQSLNSLVNEPILSVNEAREQLGYSPVQPTPDTEDTTQKQIKLTYFPAATKHWGS